MQCKRMIFDESCGYRVAPEYEGLAAFGALVDDGDIDTIIRANSLCHDLGMDPVSCAGTIACWQEAEEKEGLSKDDMLAAVKACSEGKIVGDMRYAGAFWYAMNDRPIKQENDTKIQKHAAAMVVKRCEIPPYDPRGAYGLALAYAVSNSGGVHTRAYPLAYELLRTPVPIEPLTFEGKAWLVKTSEDMYAVADSLSVCQYALLGAGLSEYIQAYAAVTGDTRDMHELLHLASRMFDQERILNQKVDDHYGRSIGIVGKEADMLPERFFTQKTDALQPISREEFKQALSQYYHLRGWDDDGQCTRNDSNTPPAPSQEGSDIHDSD